MNFGVFAEADPARGRDCPGACPRSLISESPEGDRSLWMRKLGSKDVTARRRRMRLSDAKVMGFTLSDSGLQSTHHGNSTAWG